MRSMRSLKQGFSPLLVVLAALGVLALSVPAMSSARGAQGGRSKGPGTREHKKHHKHKRHKHRPIAQPTNRLIPFDSCEALSQYSDEQARRMFGANYRPRYNPNPPAPL